MSLCVVKSKPGPRTATALVATIALAACRPPAPGGTSCCAAIPSRPFSVPSGRRTAACSPQPGPHSWNACAMCVGRLAWAKIVGWQAASTMARWER